MISRIKEKMFDNNRYLFLIISILFGLIFIFEWPHGDDVSGLYVIKGDITLSAIFKMAYGRADNSFSRLLANLLSVSINNAPRYVFIITMMISMYILLEALRCLFTKDKENQKYLNIVIAFIVCSFSYSDLTSAGWIITSTMYFTLIAFMFVAIIPIKKLILNIKIGLGELVWYIVAFLIGSSMEQGMAVLLICYIVAAVYMILTKKYNLSIIVLTILSILSAIIVLTKDSTQSRMYFDTIKYFPTFNMLNFINKIDIGLFSILSWLFFGMNLSVYVVLIMFTILVFIRYRSWFYRIISLIPEVLCVLSRKVVNNNLSINAYEISSIEYGTSNYGLFNLASYNSVSTIIQYVSMMAILIVVIIELIILTDNAFDLLVVFTLLAGGFGSRFVMALTPNVFASQYRTFMYLGFCVIAVGIYVFTKNYKLINQQLVKISTICMYIAIPLLLLYFFTYMFNYGGTSIFEIFRRI